MAFGRKRHIRRTKRLRLKEEILQNLENSNEDLNENQSDVDGNTGSSQTQHQHPMGRSVRRRGPGRRPGRSTTPQMAAIKFLAYVIIFVSMKYVKKNKPTLDQPQPEVVYSVVTPELENKQKFRNIEEF